MEHNCIQQENMGSLKKAAENLEVSISRLDKRINGTFDTIGKHIGESDFYRNLIIMNQTTLKNLKEEKNNTTKASQWRVGLIVGIVIAIMNIISNIVLRLVCR